MRIKVKALVTGVHACSGLYLEEGREYELEQEHFGDQIMERVEAAEETTTPDPSLLRRGAKDRKKEGEQL